MKLRILLLLGWTAWFAPAQESSCHPVEGDRIQARDLAAVLPEFRTAPADTLLGQAALPGSQRIFRANEIQALAHRFGVTLASPADVCFEWALHPLDRVATITAMQQALQLPDAHIEIAELISTRVPAGRIDFPPNLLGSPAASVSTAPVLWRGNVVYGEDHKFPVWARVRITADCRKLTAVESLKVGQPIESRQLKETTVTCFPVSAKMTPPAEILAGMVPVRPIASGSEVRPEMLAPPNDVNRGDEVRVEVRSGGARLAFTGRAISGGRSGDTITVINPESKRNFPARVTGKGMALVDAGSPRGL